jgi:NAD(P)-dependent dehydrogenase (short-subunit alcohol dehydrogenase family)
MRDFTNKVAVVTGAASGIGLALAKCFAHEGMRVVLADRDASALAAAEATLRTLGAKLLAVRVDVSQAEEVEALAAATLEAFGAVHILCNNAGIAGAIGPIWERSVAEWDVALGVNVYGVIHGIRSFVPIMVRQGEPAHIVNTASVAGLRPRATFGVYATTKHAVVCISEVLHAELAALGAPIGVSVLCPGFVHTRLVESVKTLPANASPEVQDWLEQFKTLVAGGADADFIGEKVLEGIRDEKLHILTHPEFIESIVQRVTRITGDRDSR